MSNPVMRPPLAVADAVAAVLALGVVDYRTGYEISFAAFYVFPDALLVAVAHTLRAGLRTTDLVARLGGDEFAALLIETDDGTATRLAEALRERLLTEARRRSWPVTFSIGLVTCAVVPPSVDALVQLADAQVYHAKREGKNRLVTAPFPS